MDKNYKINISFLNDLKELMLSDLNAMGYSINRSETEEKICHKYFNLKKRLVDSSPKEIFISKELNCPPGKEAVLETIRGKIMRGDDIKPYLSTKILDLEYNDPMLNDWGIYHLHLGDITRRDGFIERTGPLLYVRFDDKKAYFINVFSHDDWANQDVIKIIHENWPESISKFILRGVTSVEKNFSNEEYRSLRNAGVSLLISIEPGVIYALLGGGYATSGTSLEVITTCDRIRKSLRESEKYVKENIKYLESLANEKGISLEEEINFGLIIKENNKIFAYDKKSDFEFQIGIL